MTRSQHGSAAPAGADDHYASPAATTESESRQRKRNGGIGERCPQTASPNAKSAQYVYGLPKKEVPVGLPVTEVMRAREPRARAARGSRAARRARSRSARSAPAFPARAAAARRGRAPGSARRPAAARPG